jgi:hypothetical protein
VKFKLELCFIEHVLGFQAFGLTEGVQQTVLPGKLRRYSYGLNGRGSIPSKGKIFYSPRRPDRLGAHPASYPMGTGGSFPGGNVAEA